MPDQAVFPQCGGGFAAFGATGLPQIISHIVQLHVLITASHLIGES